jgi:hypothetical protein
MKVIPETYMMNVFPETYLMKVIPETYMMKVSLNRIAKLGKVHLCLREKITHFYYS